jgi:hypothetical protein
MGIIYLTPLVMMSDLDASHRHSLVRRKEVKTAAKTKGAKY